MNITRTTISLLLLAALGASAHAQSAKTREQVKAELREALRAGDVVPAGEAGLKLNELYPQRYPKTQASEAKTRAQVQAELAEAIRTGDVVAAGEGVQKLNEANPQRYPTVAVAPGKTRQQVKAETLEAIRTGDIVAAGEAGLRLNELFPQRYRNGTAQATASDSKAMQPTQAMQAMSAGAEPSVR